MNQYIKDKKADQTSIDKPVGETTTLADILKDEKDALIENIENQDLSIGRKQAAKEVINELRVKDVLNFSENTKSSIMQIIQDTQIPIEGLTYKGVKDLLLSTDGKATSEKKVTPTGPLFQVLNAVSSEFGIDPLRILANQDLNTEQRKQAQNYIFNKSTNNDGSFNTA